MFGYVYKTTNILDGKTYIGQRKGEFDPDYYGSGLYLKHAVNKYGKDLFILQVLCYAEDKQKIDELEKQYIKEYRKKFDRDRLYNITDGGEGFFGEFEAEHCKNISLARLKRKEKLGYINSPETRKKIGLSSLGNTYRRGKKHSEDVKEKNRVAHLGRKDSLETKEKKRLVKLGRIWVNNKVHRKWVRPNEINDFISNGWIKGFKIKGDKNE